MIGAVLAARLKSRGEALMRRLLARRLPATRRWGRRDRLPDAAMLWWEE